MKCSPLFALLVVLFSVLGCSGESGPALGKVSGVVTLDGSPLDQATLRFQPPQGRSSIGVTDENGHYTLQYTPERNGAELGEHQVFITTLIEQTGGEGDIPLVPGRKEMLPGKYHAKSELTAKVNKGSNDINFDLTSK